MNNETVKAAELANLHPNASGFTASTSYRYYAVGILFVVYGLNYLDRQILSILMEPIKKEFTFSDMQLGLLGGFAFAALYTTLGIVIARFADRYNRVTIISISMIVWSIFTAVTGKAQGFWTLFAARVGVGIGEAGCNPPAYSIISDYFELKRRATMLSIYSLGVYLGQFLGYQVVHQVEPILGWRYAFYVVGAPGILLAIVLKLTLREPPRGFSEPTGYIPTEPPPVMQVLRKLAAKPAFRNLSLAAGLHALVAYGLNNFYSSFLQRSHHMTVSEAAYALSFITLIGGLTGTYLGGWLSDKFASRNNGDPRYQLWVPAIALIINTPIWLLALTLPDRYTVYALFTAAILFGATYLGPSISSTHQLVGVRERALGGAMLLFVLNIIGLGMGPVLSGFISDKIAISLIADGMDKTQALADGLKYALCIMAMANLWSAYHYFRGAKTLREDIAKG
ncbi:MAG: MFS transporter [Candidatus Obscuribacterales bacterium]|nr:MFS transporter [Steroidobacteraceae bacterium]